MSWWSPTNPFTPVNAKLDTLTGLVRQLVQQGAKVMAEIDDLNAAVTSLAANFTTLDTAVQAEIAALQAALASGDATAIKAAAETAATNIGAVSSQMAADAQKLTGSLAPPAQAAKAPK